MSITPQFAATETELLAAYTKASHAHSVASHEMFAFNAQLEATVKNHTRNLKAALTKILRGSEWRTDSAKYWLGINHAVRPMTSYLHVSLVIERYGKGKGMTHMCYNFAPARQAEVLAEIERIVKPAQPHD
jgi:hypothetical protein